MNYKVKIWLQLTHCVFWVRGYNYIIRKMELAKVARQKGSERKGENYGPGELSLNILGSLFSSL